LAGVSAGVRIPLLAGIGLLLLGGWWCDPSAKPAVSRVAGRAAVEMPFLKEPSAASGDPAGQTELGADERLQNVSAETYTPAILL
jgi:hypothetical protein